MTRSAPPASEMPIAINGIPMMWGENVVDISNLVSNYCAGGRKWCSNHDYMHTCRQNMHC